eukprot:TRINITY_DN4235_c0_g2_i1.p1 TRINITY_DN4235_c0_g2~~TRINITY_DN4235_c0_g2_i1.p1  ORF type:complete len:620 (-),score=155.98 TRINITY_DN4235_c0_g2_i1:62-1921(-)
MCEMANMIFQMDQERSDMIAALENTLCTPLQKLVDTQIQDLLQNKFREFVRTTELIDTAAVKHSKMKKGAAGSPEAEQGLTETRRLRRESILDLAKGINQVKDRFRVILLEGVQHEAQLYNDAANNGVAQLAGLSLLASKMERTARKKRDEICVKEKEDEQRKLTLLLNDAVPAQPSNATTEGYLFKCSSGSKSWERRYFLVKDGYLLYYKKKKNPQPDKAFDILLTTVHLRQDLDRRFCFEVLMPSANPFLLQAESQELMNTWISTISNARMIKLAAGKAGQQQQAAPTSVQSTVTSPEMRKLRELHRSNGQCADCGAPDPEWISINAGVLVCIECSGVHRKLGTHITKTRSLALDVIEPEILLMLAALGNNAANGVWCRCVPPGTTPITPAAVTAARREWITDKYERKAFVGALSAREDAAAGLYDACKKGDVRRMLYYLAHGAPLGADAAHGKKPLLHIAVKNKYLACLWLLIVNGFPLDIRDEKGCTALHYAVMSDQKAETLALLHAGASTDVVDADGQTVLDIAESQRRVNCLLVLKAHAAARRESEPGEQRRSHVAQFKELSAYTLDELLAQMDTAARAARHRHHSRSRSTGGECLPALKVAVEEGGITEGTE